MKKIIQTRVDANGDVHLEFSGFAGHDCQTEEDRLRRELALMGLRVGVRLSPKQSGGRVVASQEVSALRKNVQ